MKKSDIQIPDRAHNETAYYNSLSCYKCEEAEYDNKQIIRQLPVRRSQLSIWRRHQDFPVLSVFTDARSLAAPRTQQTSSSTRKSSSDIAARNPSAGLNRQRPDTLPHRFVKKCGSRLPWLTHIGRAYVIPAGPLDDTPPIKPMHNIYYADRAEWYADVCKLTRYDELPVR